MTLLKLIQQSLRYYAGRNLLLALGVAISGAVLTGALLVGDSVDHSLKQIVGKRLGEVTHVLQSADRYFTLGLGEAVSEDLQIPVSSVLLQEGSASASGGRVRLSKVQVLGVDSSFDPMAGSVELYSRLSGDSVLISSNLAARLNLTVGDEFLLRLQKASLVPRNAPFVSDAESPVSLRVYVKAIAGEAELGRFHLKSSQTSPFNIFLSRERLLQLMELEDRANVLLFDAFELSRSSGKNPEERLWESMAKNFSPGDAGLKLKYADEGGEVRVSSDRVFIDDALVTFLRDSSSEGILSYFVNSIASSSSLTPYSFVSTLPNERLESKEIIVNTWLAEDLDLAAGDSVRLSYFLVGPLRELIDTSTMFVVKEVVGIEGRFADRELMPDLPGLSDAGNCRDWETGVPIALEDIRDKDEDYWDDYGGLPKAFVSEQKAVELWENRFGTYTQFRFKPEEGKRILAGFDPAGLGFSLESARDGGIASASGGVDFSELFGGLSFFLLLAGIILSVLLFLLNLEGRRSQLQTLSFMGLPAKTIRRVVLAEQMLVALAGSLLGLLLALLYTRLVFHAMNGVWSGVVRSEMMEIRVKPGTLMSGFLANLLIAFLAIRLPLRLKAKASVKKKFRLSAGKGMRLFSLALIVVALAIVGLSLLRGEVDHVSRFFASGGLLLLGLISLVYNRLSGTAFGKGQSFDLRGLATRNARRNLLRSMSVVILFAIGAFLVITTGSNRKDLHSGSERVESGTGGFLYYAESTAAVLRNLNAPEVRREYGLEEDYQIVQLRRAEGDDASCLNLNKIVNPRILGVVPGQLDGRFSFVTRTSYLDPDHPWLSLEQELPGGLIPAIADETVIKWGLGLKLGDTLHYSNSAGKTMDLLLIGGMAPSIFQGSVLIDENRFLEQYPESSGSHVFLVEGNINDSILLEAELARSMRDLGWEMEFSSDRLAEFNSVSNTYLSIFQVLGALGLLVGTFGLLVVLYRSIMERRPELALLKALGYSRRQIAGLLIREYLLLLVAGIGTGFFTAIIATLPSILNTNTGTSFVSILVWLIVLLLNGGLWIIVVSSLALRKSDIYAALRTE